MRYAMAALRRLFRLSPTTPDVPGDDDREASGDPVEHEGATEKFGDELKALRNAPVAPELITDTEMDLQWALVWHDCEHRWQAEVDRIFAEAQAELQRPRTFDEVRELVAA